MSSSTQPTRKVSAAGIGGAVATVAVWVLTLATGVDVPAPVAVAIGAVCSFAGGYIVRDAAPEEGDGTVLTTDA